MKKYIIAVVLVLVVIAVYFMFNTGQMHIKDGTYQSGEIENEGKLSMLQFDGDEFLFFVHLAMSYAPGGNFEISGDEITLIGRGEDEVFNLKILSEDELKLMDFPSRYEKILEKGQVYKYQKTEE